MPLGHIRVSRRARFSPSWELGNQNPWVVPAAENCSEIKTGCGNGSCVGYTTPRRGPGVQPGVRL